MEKIIFNLSILLIINLIIGYFYPLFGIIMTPLLISFVSAYVIFNTIQSRFELKLLRIYLFIGLNDLFLKLFAGGVHDSEGVALINVSTWFGLIPCLVIILIGAYREKKMTGLIKILSVLSFSLLVVLHFLVFGKLSLQ